MRKLILIALLLAALPAFATQASQPSCTFTTLLSGGPVQASCTNPNATTPTLMVVTLDGTTPTSNGLGTAPSNGWALSPVASGSSEYTGYFSINVSGLTVKIIAGVNGETDSAVASYTPTVPTQQVLSSYFGFQCGPSTSQNNCPQVAGVPTWPTTTGVPSTLRLHDSNTEWSVIQPANGSSFNWTTFNGYLADIAAHNPGAVAEQFTSVPCWTITTNGGGCNATTGCLVVISNYPAGTNCPPSDLGTGPYGSSPSFNTFVSAFLAHCTSQYGSTCPIRIWQLWNEADLTVHWNGTFAQLYAMVAYPAQLIHAAIPNAIIVMPSMTPASGTAAADLTTWLQLENTNGRISDWVDWHDYLTATSTTTHTPEVQWSTYNSALLAAQASVPGFVDAPWMNSETSFNASTGYGCPNGSNGTSAQYTTQDCTGQIVRQVLLHGCYGLGSQAFGNVGLFWYYWNTTFTASPTAAAYQNAYLNAQNYLAGGHCTTQPTNSSGTVWTVGFVRSSGVAVQFVWTTSESAGQNYTVPSGYTDFRDFAGGLTRVTSGQSVAITTQPLMLEQATYANSTSPQGVRPGELIRGVRVQ